MRKSLPVTILSLALLAGCGWFGGGGSAVDKGTSLNPLLPADYEPPAPDRRNPLAHIDTIDVVDVPGGKVFTVTATASVQGSYNISFQAPQGSAAAPEGSGVIRYLMLADVAAYTKGAVVGTAQSREVTAAFRLSNIELAGISRVEVVGVQNVLSVSP
ncbi:hypothetical protein [Pseudooceanicola algae]|uniref:Lipoprotein n=1 Tax=Pseudooceanicola algae TaxID=1537215 RepID=A0A418SEK2_9RHOB|nr:hypothetical protein [Pseudooceanicola algae]QPM89669.1 hypothetical protein PSAL_008940 [Pseudooceanicola algae]